MEGKKASSIQPFYPLLYLQIMENSVSSCGNGKVCAYSRGADMFDLIGPYYSTPTFCEMTVDCNCEVVGKRTEGTNIWNYNFNEVGSLREFTAKNLPLYIRSFNFNKPLNWSIRKKNVDKFTYAPNSISKKSEFHSVYVGEISAGTLFYTNSFVDGKPCGYPVSDRLAIIIAIKGNIKSNLDDDTINLSIQKGDVYFIVEKSMSEAWILFDKIHDNTEELYNENLNYWNEFTANRKLNVPPLDESVGINKKINQAVDDVATLIKSQQGSDGGVIAGYNYHLAYIRDNYGVHRGLLAMGCYNEDKSLMLYYANVYNKYGVIRNAQGIGTYAFHVHENDYTEITGYIVLMAMEYFNKTRDLDTVKIMLPLLKWCMEVQRVELKNGMLPFNGDETYIAGGVLPRINIVDGSMEATLLYHRACELLLPFLDKYNLVCDCFIDIHQKSMEKIEASFNENFIKDGILYCNHPDFYTLDNAPSIRGGVRECGHGFGISYKTDNLRYVCIDCLSTNKLPKSENTLYNLNSTALMPIWVGSNLVPKSILDNMIKTICGNWLDSGVLPSRPDGGTTVGYDYGLLMYALKGSVENKEAYSSLFDTIISIRDNTGAWVEYYINNVPNGTKCRPWESAVNIAGILI